MTAVTLSSYELVIACSHCRKDMLFSGAHDLLAPGEHCSVRADRGSYRVEFDLRCSDCSKSTTGSVRISSRRLEEPEPQDIGQVDQLLVRAALANAQWPGS